MFYPLSFSPTFKQSATSAGRQSFLKCNSNDIILHLDNLFSHQPSPSHCPWHEVLTPKQSIGVPTLSPAAPPVPCSNQAGLWPPPTWSVHQLCPSAPLCLTELTFSKQEIQALPPEAFSVLILPTVWIRAPCSVTHSTQRGSILCELLRGSQC